MQRVIVDKNSPKIFVTTKRQQIQVLDFCLDIANVHGEQYDHDLHKQPDQCWAGRDAKLLRRKSATDQHSAHQRRNMKGNGQVAQPVGNPQFLSSCTGILTPIMIRSLHNPAHKLTHKICLQALIGKFGKDNVMSICNVPWCWHDFQSIQMRLPLKAHHMKSASFVSPKQDLVFEA